MYQGTTPAIIFTINGMDVSQMTPYVSFKRGRDVLTKSTGPVSIVYDPDEQKSIIVCQLTQEETLNMRKGSAVAQIRFIDSSNNAYATSKARIRVNDVIYPEVITFGGDA